MKRKAQANWPGKFFMRNVYETAIVCVYVYAWLSCKWIGGDFKNHVWVNEVYMDYSNYMGFWIFSDWRMQYMTVRPANIIRYSLNTDTLSKSYRVERVNLGYNFTVLPLTSHRSNPRRLKYAVFTKNYRETVLFKIMKELAPLGYDTENAALSNGFVWFPAKNGWRGNLVTAY